MHIPGRQRLVAALVTALAALAVVHPALSFAHALEHVQEARALDPSEEPPREDEEGGAHCDLCLSLSLSRTALVPKGVLAQVRTALVGRIEPALPLPVPVRASRAPESPRAPPRG